MGGPRLCAFVCMVSFKRLQVGRTCQKNWTPRRLIADRLRGLGNPRFAQPFSLRGLFWVSRGLLQGSHLSHNQNPVVKWSTHKELRRRISAAIYGWDSPLLTFIYSGFDCDSFQVQVDWFAVGISLCADSTVLGAATFEPMSSDCRPNWAVLRSPAKRLTFSGLNGNCH